MRQLEYFVAVAETGSFGAAAQTLHISQPGLSKQIAVLEAEQGLTLFRRTSRSVALTQEGSALLKEAKTTLAAARSFRSLARKLAGDASTRFLAGVLPSIGAYFMPRLRERLQSRKPDIRISLVEGPSRELLARLRSGELDFVIASISDATGLECLPLFEETLWFCSAPGDPLMDSDTPSPLSALAGRPLLTLSPEFYLTRVVEQLAREIGATLSSEYRGASLDAIRQMAASGDGIAILPSLYALGEAIRDPNFKVRRIDHPDAIHPVFLYWRPNATDPAFFRSLGEEMIAEKMQIRAERDARFQI
ncbi:LysR family transcriptional regulator [Hyphobacterium sp.]|uniref:LysR family transcriptional regulator n=1 Tax=Hyphobacterium sp. TaxID=2004662 RepID=UPI003BAA9C19